MGTAPSVSPDGLPPPRTAEDNAKVRLTTPELRVSNLAKLAPEDPLAELIAARLPTGTAITLAPDQRRALLRRRVPGRELALRDSGMVRFTAPTQPVPSQSGCFALAIPLDPGAYLDSGAVAATPCRNDADRPALYHDPRAGAPFATAPLSAGTYLGRLTLRDGRVVGAGSRMRMIAAAGPVVIEREVHTLQPARSGQRVFVSNADGAVIASRLAIREQP